MPRKDNKRKDNKENQSFLFKVIVIILLIIIIILLLLNSSGSIGNTNRGEYTGSFDIYEITLKGTCECPVCEKCQTCSGSNQSSGNNSVNNNSNDESEIGDYQPNLNQDKVIVYDKESEWVYEDNVQSYRSNIFKHSATEVVNGVIAPGMQNSYKFIVRNLNDFVVKYSVKALENNPNGINMKYRLRTANSYVIGGDNYWVDASNIETATKKLTSKGIDVYYLDWKWFDNDEFDTPIGIDDAATYGISLKVEAEQV